VKGAVSVIKGSEVMGTMTVPAEKFKETVEGGREMPFTVTVPKTKSPATRNELLLRLTDVPLVQGKQLNMAGRLIPN
jgi:hypothetical protein